MTVNIDNLEALRTEIEDILGEADDNVQDAVEKLETLYKGFPLPDYAEERAEAERWHKMLVLQNTVGEVLAEMEDEDDDEEETDPEAKVTVLAVKRVELRAGYKALSAISSMALLTQTLTPEEGVGLTSLLQQFEKELRSLND